jgi:hypothetical protein
MAEPPYGEKSAILLGKVSRLCYTSKPAPLKHKPTLDQRKVPAKLTEQLKA